MHTESINSPNAYTFIWCKNVIPSFSCRAYTREMFRDDDIAIRENK